MIIVRYEGPSGAPGMPEMLDSTSRITTLCRENNIVVGLMTDGRFSGGSVGLVIGHVGPEAALGGEIAFIENGDEIIIDLNIKEINCTELKNADTLESRKTKWKKVVDENGGMHPSVGNADTRLLNRMRRSAVSAIYGAGMHPDMSGYLHKLKAEKVIYVSCNPTTQARDVKILNDNDYKIKNSVMVDMFPHTPHIETVMLLSK